MSDFTVALHVRVYVSGDDLIMWEQHNPRSPALSSSNSARFLLK